MREIQSEINSGGAYEFLRREEELDCEMEAGEGEKGEEYDAIFIE